jgi:hypothetical protein
VSKQLDPLDRFRRAQQHRAALSDSAGDDVHAVVHPVGEIDIQVTGLTEHHVVARCSPPEGVARRIVRLVGLDLDDPGSNDASGKPPCEHTSEQGRGNFVRRPRQGRSSVSGTHR